MWQFKENELDEDTCMDAPGFVFPRITYTRKKREDSFLSETSIGYKKNIHLASLPYSIFELLHPRPQHTEKGSHCARTSLQVVKFAT
jgi:hypothetical protein